MIFFDKGIFLFTVVFLILFLLFCYFLLWSSNKWILSGVEEKFKAPILPMEAFPEHKLLEDNWLSIKEEAVNALGYTELASTTSEAFFGKIADEKWKVFMLKFYGKDFEANLERCPKTAALLSQIPRIKYAMFSVMEPETVVPEHHGPYRGYMRYHLGLQVPKDRGGCHITVDGKKYHWKEGEGFLFDDAYLHQVQNKTKETRIILFCDVERDIPGIIGSVNRRVLNSKIPQMLFYMNSKNEKASKVFDE